MTGCAARVGTSGAVYVPKDSAAQCAAQCQSTGMVLSSMVVMANNVGCVCSPAGAQATACPNAATGGAAGGLAALMMTQHDDEDQQRRSQQRSRH